MLILYLHRAQPAMKEDTATPELPESGVVAKGCAPRAPARAAWMFQNLRCGRAWPVELATLTFV